MSDAEGHLERLRRDELAQAGGYLRPGLKVLEVGGSRGFQAKILADYGCDVCSIDVMYPPAGTQYYPVQLYDGRRIPFGAAAFDIVFSSHTLEHVRDLDEALGEIRRVLVAGGLAIHILPSTTWRLWTSLARYVHGMMRVLGWRRAEWREVSATTATSPRQGGWRDTLQRLITAGPHGEYPSASAELYYFSRYRWRRVFGRGGFEVLHARGCGIFYTGYELFPDMPTVLRRLLAHVLGSASHIFVTRPLGSKV